MRAYIEPYDHSKDFEGLSDPQLQDVGYMAFIEGSEGEIHGVDMGMPAWAYFMENDDGDLVLNKSESLEMDIYSGILLKEIINNDYMVIEDEKDGKSGRYY